MLTNYCVSIVYLRETYYFLILQNRVVIYQPHIHVHTVPQTQSWKAKYPYAYGAIMLAYTLILVFGGLLMIWALPCSIVALISACYVSSL